MGDPVGSRERELFDPVTTEAKAEMETPGESQIYELHKTPALLIQRGEGIVCAAGNSGYTRSSDLHEWRNDLGTVSTRDSAKLQYE